MAQYTHLLGHLHRPSSSLPLDAVNAAIAHHLATLEPYPTPLAAAVVSSPFFLPLSHQKLQGLTTAFRHASHIKYKALQDDKGSIFARSPDTRFRQWISSVLKGIQGGQPIIKLACCGGVLLALHDLHTKSSHGDGPHSSRVEDEVVVALAEIMDNYAYMLSSATWEREFRSLSDGQEVDALSLALVLASQSLPHVSSDKLKALPLRPFARLLVSTIDSAFLSGSFLSSLATSVTMDKSSVICIAETTPFAKLIQVISTSVLMSSIGPLSKLCARVLSLLLASNHEQGIATIVEALQTLQSLTLAVESHWAASPLSGAKDENRIVPDSRPITEKTWAILKTLLFSTVMIADACLSAFVYTPAHIAQQPSPSPPSFSPVQVSSAATLIPSSSSLAHITLQTFSHLSFVISQFGGVGSTSEGGFTELKRVFYLALDILAADRKTSEEFVLHLCASFHSADPPSETYADSNALFYHAKRAYGLAVIEQLVPVISPECIELHVLPLCLPHLIDADHRETYELAHSVVLTAFSAHAQCVGERFIDTAGNRKGKDVDKGESRPLAFIDKLVPFYANCLIENSADGKLSTMQLRLAFSALVRSASASANVSDVPSLADDRYALAWFCVESLLDAIRGLSVSGQLTSSVDGDSGGRLHRLHLTLISTISSLPLSLLPRLLSEVHTTIVRHPDGGRKRELIQELFDEILEKVSDREKEFAMRWWYDNRESLGCDEASSAPVHEMQASLQSRL